MEKIHKYVAIEIYFYVHYAYIVYMYQQCYNLIHMKANV